MIFAKSRIWPSSRQDEILSGLQAYINRVRSEKTLDRERVIRALDTLGRRIAAGEFDGRIASLAAGEKAERYKAMAARSLSRAYIEDRIRRELSAPEEEDGPIRTEWRPLGTLFHIAAGNMDGLPALSAAEGLVTGNFNILKLPQADDGLTVEILSALCDEEPDIGDFAAVFDTPSSDTAAMLKMAALADGIVFWGGEEAERAVRTMAPPGVKLIEWGHRLGFAYVSGDWRGDAFREELEGLAEHIAVTGQLLCSSAQVVYLDTASMKEAEDFAAYFLPLLEKASARHPASDMGEAAVRSIRARVGRLEAAVRRAEKDPDSGGVPDRLRLEGSGCSVTVCRDSLPELSPLYGSVLVKRLPERQLLPVLRRSAGKLQTAGLVCPPCDRERLTELLIRAGLNRVTRAAHMSDVFPGEAHDGEYPLRRYVRAVNVERIRSSDGRV